MLEEAQFVRKAGLYKERRDKIKRFYYYKTEIRGKEAYLNVGETDYINKRGKIKHERFLYSVTDTIKK